MRIPVLALLFSLSVQLPAQSQYLETYSSYRQRLTENFLAPGEGQGKSLPAAYRNPLFSVIKWADATIDLGWYIAVLAVENHLLSHPEIYPDYTAASPNLASNTEALYQALKALERLDEQAETAFLLCPGLPDRNGFFIRDDVPAGFHTHFPGMSAVLSDMISINIYDKEMSQDQMYHVLMGLSLVSALVDPAAEIAGTNLGDFAREQAALIVDHVAGFSNWTIKNPVCNEVVYRGPDAWSLSFGTNKSLKFITNNAVDYSNDLVVILNEGVWPGLGTATNPIHINSDNTHMIMVLGAMGKVWNDATLSKLMNLAGLQDFYLYPLLHAALYGKESVPSWPQHAETLRDVVEDMLAEAPAAGPASPQPLPGTHGWGSSNRFIRKRADHVNGGNGTAGNQFNGLDFLLLHNLYYLLFTCPQADFAALPSDTICLTKTDIDLEPYGRPSGGTFSGPGVLADRYFNPSQAGPGWHTLVYTYTGEAGCASADSILVFTDVCASVEYGALTAGSLYPNPTAGKTTVQFALSMPARVSLELTDAAGRVLWSGEPARHAAGDVAIPLDFSYLRAGMYYLVARINDSETKVWPLVRL